MDRDEIRQHVEDALGVILVDKSVIQENSTLNDLVLDEDDIDELFHKLASDFGIVLKKSDRTKVQEHPERITVMSLIDQIFMSLNKNNSP
jgi:acyl carrier protein